MKNAMKWMFGVMLLTIGISLSAPHTAQAQYGDAVTYQTFYDELSPYGDWIYDPDYGYVWAPRAGNDFRPYYTNGRWAMTQYGNTWVSGYDWGWAPFHYGRWTYNRFYGWVWIPGTTWGPAWVSWRHGGGNYGWAPMGPGISINISFGNNYYVPYDWWTFVPCGNIYSGYYNNYWRGAGYNNTYIHNTVIINNTYNSTYVYGPRRNEVEQVTGGRVNVYNIREGKTSGRNRISGNEVNIYRPAVRTVSGNRKEAPRDFVRANKSRTIKSASPALTGRTAMERNQREQKAAPARNTAVERTSERNNAQRTIERGTRETAPVNTARQTEARNEREQQANRERMQQEQQKAQQRAVREQQAQAERRQRTEREQQIRVQREHQQAQQRELREQQARVERQQRAQQEQQRAQQQQRLREQQVQQRPTRQAPQREWRRPKPQRMEQRSVPTPRQSAPVQRGGVERGGRR